MNHNNCHLCNGMLLELDGFSSLFQVTSDCRPWHKGGHLFVCQDCGTVQKSVKEDWLREAEKIYGNYQIYNQSEGAEQNTFDQNTGASEARSHKIVQWLATHHTLPKTGKLLDIGCGNGAFLKAFGARYPEWRMSGLELDSRNQRVIEAIPGVEALHVGKIDSLKDSFDLIVIIHALEHIPNPIKFLKSIAKRLNPGGLLMIEVPSLETSPFDIVVADHCTYFTEETLKWTVESGGFETISLTSDFVPKEISFLSKYIGVTGSKEIKQSNGNGAKAVKSNIAWLQDLLQKGKEIKGKIGIFGTSISATWLAASLGDKVSFFVDEDENRVGHTHMNCPILKPDLVTANSTILLPMRSDIAVAIAKRLEKIDSKFILPSTNCANL
jgi:2-polyprenyl-3-methyl-5-hydroxy-6-metoxy-1,4-benzoquinol methylase